MLQIGQTFRGDPHSKATSLEEGGGSEERGARSKEQGAAVAAGAAGAGAAGGQFRRLPACSCMNGARARTSCFSAAFSAAARAACCLKDSALRSGENQRVSHTHAPLAGVCAPFV